MACDSKLIDMSLDEIIKLNRRTQQVVGKKAGGYHGRLAVRSAAGTPPARPPTHKMYWQHRRRQKAIIRSQQLNQGKGLLIPVSCQVLTSTMPTSSNTAWPTSRRPDTGQGGKSNLSINRFYWYDVTGVVSSCRNQNSQELDQKLREFEM
ncbi:unnamed protein product [Mesocestoides corti]|uniref:Uncharacterized protein n=1 Tax=Mesocestoides corti TaxID=53468 RepID=A0A0R3UQ71_MESCO|nr:unnamed protein product [Mesocestoides corti]